MKPISGEVISSKPITISKAAAVLAKFASSETCATPEISEYLSRASAAFGELVEYHRRLEGRGKAKDEALDGGEGERRDLDGLDREKETKPRRNMGALAGEERKEGRKEKMMDRGCLEVDGGEKRTNGEGSAAKSHKKNRKDKGEIGGVMENGVESRRKGKKKGGAIGEEADPEVRVNVEVDRKKREESKKKIDRGDRRGKSKENVGHDHEKVEEEKGDKEDGEDSQKKRDKRAAKDVFRGQKEDGDGGDRTRKKSKKRDRGEVEGEESNHLPIKKKKKRVMN